MIDGNVLHSFVFLSVFGLPTISVIALSLNTIKKKGTTKILFLFLNVGFVTPQDWLELIFILAYSNILSVTENVSFMTAEILPAYSVSISI